MEAKYQLTPSQLVAVKRIKSLFPDAGAKIELEANLGRGDCDNDSSYCDYCEEGYVECPDCYGSGVYEYEHGTPNGRTINLTEACTNCEGEGRATCSECDGDYEQENSYSDGHCESFILDYVSYEARRALTYSQFYYDGSVDSEFTFSLPLSALQYAPEYLDAFRALAQEIGNELDTSGAGMHLTILPDGRYPCRSGLDAKKLANFKTEVTKLLPALLFAASPDATSRPLDYRKPRISDQKSGVYPAICTHGDTCLEYRIFETCYGNPAQLLENFEVIANTLKYYSHRQIKQLKKAAEIHDPAGETVSRFFYSAELLAALNTGLRYLKPKNQTIAAMKKQRRFKVNVKELMRAEQKAKARYQSDYQEYVEYVNGRNERILERHMRYLEEIRENASRYQDSNERTDFIDFCLEPGTDRERLESYLDQHGEFDRPTSFADWCRRNHYSFEFATN